MGVLEAPAPNTPEWQTWRRGGLGASEIAATLGLHPFITERALALRKRGLAPDVEQTAAMSWGHRMEEVGAQEYAARTGRVLLPGPTVVHPRWPHLFATPDRLVQGERRGVELKWTNRWEAAPRYVRIQAQAQNGIAELDVVDVVRMGPYGEPSWESVERDEADIRSLLDWGEEWFRRFVLGDELPEEDGSEASRHYAESHLGTGVMRATGEQARLMERLRRARQDKAAAEAEEALVRDLLCRSMAGFDELEGDGFRVLWRQAKGARRTAWELVAKAYRELILPKDASPELVAQIDALVSLYTTTGDPTRPFKPQWEED